MARKTDENLKKGKNTQFRTGAEQAEIARRGGVASGVARRQQRTMYETLAKLMALSVKDGDIVDIDGVKSIVGLNGQNITVQEAVLLAQIKQAMKGNVKSAKYLAEMEENKLQRDAGAGVQIIDDF